MVRISETFNFGSNEDLKVENKNLQTVEELVVKLQRMYTDLAVALNTKIDLVERVEDGQITDTFLAQGTVNINLNTNKVEMLTNHPTQTTVTWTKLS